MPEKQTEGLYYYNCDPFTVRVWGKRDDVPDIAHEYLADNKFFGHELERPNALELVRGAPFAEELGQIAAFSTTALISLHFDEISTEEHRPSPQGAEADLNQGRLFKMWPNWVSGNPSYFLHPDYLTPVSKRRISAIIPK